MPRTKQFDETVVLEKAVSLFWKQGYHATSIQDLVEELGINRASLYSTFGGKKQLFERALQTYRDQNIAGIRQFLVEQPTVKTGIRRLFERAIADSVTDCERKGCFVVNVTTELAPTDTNIQRFVTDNQRIFEGIFYDYLRTGVTTGEIAADKDLRSLAGLLFALYTGIKVLAKVEPQNAKLPATVHTALDLLA